MSRARWGPCRRRREALINTPLQRGVVWRRDLRNRFNGFSRVQETVETRILHCGVAKG